MSTNTFFDDDEADGATIALVAPLTERVNSEPPIMRGLSATETMVAMAVFFPLWFVLGAACAVLFGRWQILMLMGVIGPMVSVWVSAGFLARFKRNRPDHYYWHAFIRWRHRLGIGSSVFIVHRGAWDLGRSMPQITPAREPFVKRLRKSLGL